MTRPTLPLEMPPEDEPNPVLDQRGELRLNKPVRNQAEMIVRDLDSLIAEDHPVRAIWDFLNKLDLAAFYASIKVDQNQAGRPASDPQVLLALWVYATVEGMGSARELARLSEDHDVYKWLRGGVPVDYHLLAEFRVKHQKEMDDLISQIIAVLLQAKVIELKRVSQDGMRVRASAGGGSFHRETTLKKCLAAAREQVHQVAQQREHPDTAVSQRQRAARERVAQEKQARLEAAWRQLPQVQGVKERQKKNLGQARAATVKEARVSTTDPEARTMKMANGGFNPAYNIQYATDTESQVIVGVEVSNQGNDQGQAQGMEAQVESRSGRRPEDYLIDGGFIDLKDIQAMEKKGIKVYAPARESQGGKGWYGVAKSEEVMAWRERMATEEAQAIYKERAATSECVNALMRARYGLQQFNVRGISKVLSITLLLVLAHNLLRWISLTGSI